MTTMGWDLLATYRENAELRRDELSRPPLACPNDGTPLEPSPPGHSSRLFCPFDGWKWPDDDHRPAA